MKNNFNLKLTIIKYTGISQSLHDKITKSYYFFFYCFLPPALLSGDLGDKLRTFANKIAAKNNMDMFFEKITADNKGFCPTLKDYKLYFKTVK